MRCCLQTLAQYDDTKTRLGEVINCPACKSWIRLLATKAFKDGIWSWEAEDESPADHGLKRGGCCGR